MKPQKKGGWYNEPRNHGLAAKGIKVRPNKTDYKKNMMNRNPQNNWRDISMSGKGWAYLNGTTVLQITGYGLNKSDILYVFRVYEDAGWTSEKLVYRSKDFRSKEEAMKAAKMYMKTYKNASPKWTKDELEEIQRDKYPAMNADEKRLFMKMYLGKPKSGFRAVEVTYSDGTKIATNMAADLSDAEIKKYFAKGKVFNIGNADIDKLVTVKNLKILE